MLYYPLSTLNLAVSIDCQWGRWSVGACTVSCGAGTRTKTRAVAVKETNGGKCDGITTITEPCNTLNCSSKYFLYSILIRVVVLLRYK